MSDQQTKILKGIAAGLAGGLVASWVMNQFIAGPGASLTHATNTAEENSAAAAAVPGTHQDATMKTADSLTELATGGRHLSWSQQQTSGPIVHYAFGALVGAAYGAAAEVVPSVTDGYGAGFGSVLFTGSDVLAVPLLNLGAPLTETPLHTLATPYAAHVVYGVTTEIVRRLVRAIL